MQFGRIAVTDIDQEIAFNRGIGKKFRIQFCIVKARHGAAIKPKTTQSQNEIACLKRTIAKRRCFYRIILSGKP